MIEKKKNSKSTIKLLIKTATELFAKSGYNHTSVSNIAQSCELSKASIYHYVDSKLDLAKLCVQQAYQEFKENVLSKAYDEELSAKDRFLKFTKTLEEYFNHSDSTFFVMKFSLETASTIKTINPIIENYFTDWHKAFVNLLTDTHGVQLAEKLASDMICFIQGAIVMHHIDANDTRLSQMSNFLVKLSRNSI